MGLSQSKKDSLIAFFVVVGLSKKQVWRMFDCPVLHQHQKQPLQIPCSIHLLNYVAISLIQAMQATTAAARQKSHDRVCVQHQ